MMATASFIIPSPNNTAFRTGNSYCLIRDRAATVSVAHSTLLKSMTSGVVSNPLKMKWLKKLINAVRTTKLIMVPMIPRKLMIPKFSKNKDFLRLYPAAKIMGGSMKVKKI